MQSEEYHNQHGRGRNISCNNYNCSNFKKKIGRVRGGFARHVICPICHEDGLEHSYTCTVSKNNKMECNCHLRENHYIKYTTVKEAWEQLKKDYNL